MSSVRKLVPAQSVMCLAPWTRVLAHLRGYVPAREVTVGTHLVVASFEGGPVGITRVSAAKHGTSTRFVCINQRLEVTEAHPLCTQSGEWLPAGDLRIGDWLMGRSGPQRVSSIATLDREESPVIDIITDEPFWVEEIATMSKSGYRASRGVNESLAILPIQAPAMDRLMVV